MNRYAADDEARLRTAARARDWMQSGLLDAPQHTLIQATLHTNLKRTNLSLRVVLFIFGTIVLWAALGLFVLAVGLSRDDRSIGWSMVAAGVAGFLFADALVARFRLYRFGVEEAFASSSVALVGIGVGFLVSAAGYRGETTTVSALLAASMVSLVVYMRLGYLYAAITAVVCAALAPLFLGQSPMAERFLSASVLLVVFIIARWLERPHGEDFPGDDYAVIQSAAWLGLYLVLNLGLSRELAPLIDTDRADVPRIVYWGTYVVVWVLPAAGLYLGLVDKHRGLIVTSLLMAVLTLVTNKTYLGWQRHTWDPILLGVLLTGTAIAVRRWLSRGPEGERNGFTAESLLASDDRSVATLGTIASAVQPFADRSRPADTPKFDPGRGGRSGGAGGGADF